MSDEQLYDRVAEILEQARNHVARTVNTAMVQAYWLIGREIVEVEQAGEQRAGYGEELIQRLSLRLQGVFADGSALPEIRAALLSESSGAIHQGQRGASDGQAPAVESGADIRAALPRELRTSMFPSLGWTHYLILMKVTRPEARAFYEIEAARECLSTRELERQIGALLFDRLAKNRDPEAVLALARRGQEVAKPADVIKDPFVLEFLDLAERLTLRERDIEQAIIDRLETFLLEMGKGFCFVGRQKRLTVDGDHFYVDLVFYNRLLRCFVLVDLKLGKLTHQDLGQMLMYVNYFDSTQRTGDERKTIGIVLCSEKNAAMVKITLPDTDQIVAATYQMYLPTEAELQAELTREREEAERMLRLNAPTSAEGADGDYPK